MLHDPVFRLGVLPVHPFGLCAAIGIVLGYALALWGALRASLPARYLPGMFIVVALGAFIVARIGFVLAYPTLARGGAQGVLAFWRGGLSLPAGILGGAVLLAVYTWARRESLWRWADVLSPAAALGLAIGMLGLPGGGEGWGQPTGGLIAMSVPADALPASLLARAARTHDRFQPIWAYEAVLFAGLTVVLLLIAARRRYVAGAPVGGPPAGTVGLVFLFVTMVGYGLLRPLTLDASDPTLVLRTQLFCAAVSAIACGLLVIRLTTTRVDLAVTREIERVKAPFY